MSNDRIPSTGLADLEAFLAIADSLSFRVAAETLGISQPSVSARLQKLESNLGICLIDRSTRRVALTESGARLRSKAKRAVDDVADLFLSFREEGSVRRGTVRAAVSPSLAAVLMPDVLAELQRRQPAVNVELKEVTRAEAAELLVAGRCDFALVGGAVDAPGLRFDVLYHDEFVTVAPRGHPILQLPRPSLHDIAMYPLLSLERSAIWKVVRDELDAEQVAYRVAAEAGSLLTLLALVQHGIGLSVLPNQLLRRIDLNLVGVTGGPSQVAPRAVGITQVRGKTMPPAARAMLRVLQGIILGSRSVGERVTDL